MTLSNRVKGNRRQTRRDRAIRNIHDCESCDKLLDKCKKQANMVESRRISVGERIVVVDEEYHKSISGKVIGFRKNSPGDDVILIEAEF